MANISDVRAAEKRLQEILDAFKDADSHELDRLGTELRSVSDEYMRAIQELEF